MSLRVRVPCLRLRFGGASLTLGTPLFDTCAPPGLVLDSPQSVGDLQITPRQDPVRLEKPAVRNSPRAALT